MRLLPAFDGFVITFQYWSPDNDWLHETWGSADRWLAIRCAYDKYPLGVWLAVLALLAARSFWCNARDHREANRKWQRLQTDSLRAVEQERLLEIEISVRKEQEESARRRLRQADQVRQNQLALEKDEADRLAAEAAERAEMRNKILAERALAKAKLERFQAAEAAAAIAAALARRRRSKK